MKQEYAESFIGSRLKHIPHSQLLYFNKTQLLLLAKRQTIRLDTVLETLVYTNIDDQKIIHSSYHSLLQLYLLLSEHNILVFNHGGELIKKFPNNSLFACKYFYFVSMEDGYHGVPNNRQDLLTFVKGDHLYIAKAKVNYERAMINTKGICDFTFQIQPPQLVESPQFIEGQKYLRDSQILILWNSNETYIYKLPRNWQQKFERLFIYKRISKRQNRSLDYAVSLQMKIMAVAYESGVIKMYQMDGSKKYLLDLKGHQSTCQSIYISSSNPYFLYSASTDSTVRIWNLRDYEQVYMLQLDVLIDEITFITESLLFINKKELRGKSYLCQINTNLLDPIVNDNRGEHLIKMKCDLDWCVRIYSNNLVEFSSILNQEKNMGNQKIEYPLKYGVVSDVFALDGDNYAIALEKGFSLIKFHKKEISSQNFQLKKLVYNQSIVRAKQENDEFIELIHQKLLGTYTFNMLSDWKNIPTSIKITFVYFYQSAWLPMWDNSAQLKVAPLSRLASYCVLGTSKGQIYFVDIQKRSHFYTKVYFHTRQITLIRSIAVSVKNDKVCYFLSMSLDKQLAIWKLDHEDFPAVLLQVNYNIDISYIEVFSCFLLVGEKQGEFSIIKIQLQGESVRMVKSTNIIGHLRAVICGDYMRYKSREIFLSGGEDSAIKIWRGVQKSLIYQIKLFDIINTVNFIYQRLNMIVSHNEQISLIRQQKLKELMKVDSRLDHQSDEKGTSVSEMNYREFFVRSNLLETSSPLKKNQHVPSVRYQEYTRFLQHKMSRVDEPQTPKRSRVEQSSDLTKFPLTSPQLESPERVNTKVKAFRVTSSNNPWLDNFLPPIFPRRSVQRRKVLGASTKKESSLIMQLKELKNRSYSNAGRGKQ